MVDLQEALNTIFRIVLKKAQRGLSGVVPGQTQEGGGPDQILWL